MHLSSKWYQYFTNGWFVLWWLLDKVHFCNTHKLLHLLCVLHLGKLYKTISVTVWAIGRLAGKTRTQHTEHSMWLRWSGKIIGTRKGSLAYAPKRNSGYWIGNPLTYIRKKLHLNPYSLYSAASTSCHQCTLLKVMTFAIGILTNKTGWWIRGPDFHQLSLWFFWSSQKGTIAHCVFKKKTRYTFAKMLLNIIMLHECTFSFNSK